MPERYLLIYDGECAICRRSVAWVKERDPAGSVEILPYQDPEVRARLPEIPADRMAGAMQLVAPDRTRWEGARAAEEILRILPETGWLAWPFRLPGARRIAAGVYRLIARNRRKLGCGDHCAAPGVMAGRARSSRPG